MNRRTNTPKKVIIYATCDAVLFGCETRQPKEKMYRDPCGFYWCEEHKYRGRLLTWAYKHDYPSIRYAGTDRNYAIGYELNDRQANEMLWTTAVVQGSEDMIWSALSEAMGIDDEGEEAL